MNTQTARSSKSSFGSTFAALALLAALLAGFVFVVRGIAAYVLALNSEVAKVLLPASIAVFGSIAAVAVGKAYEVRAAIRKELRDRKAPVYEELVSKLFAIFFAEKLGGAKTPELEVMKFFAWAVEKLTVWGADDVLVNFGKLQHLQGEGVGRVFAFEDFLLAIRRDLGHKNRGVGRGTVLRLFVSDFDTFIRGATETPTPAAAGPSGEALQTDGAPPVPGQ